jgi:predicted alpha-1,6-mannanase (GH76 family)
MYFPFIFVPFLPSALSAPNSSPSEALFRAREALDTLQEWYNVDTGLWNTCGWWNSANCLTILGNMALADPSQETLELVTSVFENTFARAPAGNPLPGVEDGNELQAPKEERDGDRYDKSIDPASGDYRTIYPAHYYLSTDTYTSGAISRQKIITGSATASTNASAWLDGFYDDDAWWALAWINAYDVTQNIEYLSLAEGIFSALTKAWPTNCSNGGIWWSYKQTYVNAIANELFLSLAAHLANRVSADQKQFYIDWALRELIWFLDTGMINDEGTINDGLDAECENNGFTTWSYNQGVILGGLVELYRSVPDERYLDLAETIAKAAIDELSDEDGVLHDRCGPNCGGDASQFKGIFMRGLMKLYEVRPDEVFVEAVRINAESIWENDRDARGRLSTDWAGPVVPWPNASTHSSAMEALIADVVVR